MALLPEETGSTVSLVNDILPRQHTLVPYLFLGVECERPFASSVRSLLSNVDEVTICRGNERRFERSIEGSLRRLSIQIPDRGISSLHAVLRRENDAFILEDAHSKNGTTVNGLPHQRVQLQDGDLIECGHTFFIFRDKLEAADLETPDVDTAHKEPLATGLGTLLPSLASQYEALAEIARSSVPVVVLGESGTGKELIARAVHRLSQRRGALIAVNCGALPENLVEAELFGSRRGAFSGAVEDRPGLVRASDHGTLFLDEIGDLPLRAQPALLRVLQEGQVQAVGATQPVPVDLRVVAATHRDLDTLVNQGLFRADLLARLSGFTFRQPPLAYRKEDLGLLIATLLKRSLRSDSNSLSLSREAVRALYRYHWPLNIRELERCLAAAVVLSTGRIELEQLARTVRDDERPPPPLRTVTPPPLPPLRTRPLTETELDRREQLTRLLQRHNGNISAVAREMGKQRLQIRRWIKLYKIPVKSEE